jgi:hypothetical protein
MSKCSDIQNQIGQYKAQIDNAFQTTGRIRGLLAEANTLEALRELDERRSAAVVQSNRAGNALAGLLSAAQQERCGSELETQINKEINYSRNVSRELNGIGGTIANKLITLQTKSAEKQNNAGTGTSGTAGQGAEATKPTTTVPAPVTPPAGTTANAAPTTQVTQEPKPVTPTVGANATPTTTSVVGASAPKPVGAPPPPATKPVPSPQGKPGTAEYVSGLIKGEVVKAQNALATACPDKAKAQADVKKILANLGGNISAAVATAKDAQGKPLSQTAKNALSAELQGAISTVGKVSKDIDAKNCTVAPAATPAPTEAAGAAGAGNTNTGLSGQRQDARAQATIQDTTNFEQVKDWRVRLRLSPGADYLYKAPESQQGILKYLNETDGVVFPYTPTITVSYSANYDQINPTHSNYKVLQYTNSSVDSVSISCDFTAQDTREANYLLAVIHFFRSVTKMFYGQDQNPKPGTPPPLVYLFGLGEFQFNAHPLVVTNFNYALPSDVDYIRAGAVTANPGVSREPSKPTNPSSTTALDRLKQGAAQIGQNFLNSILPGGESGPPSFTPSGFSAITAAGTVEPTYVPTKINLQIQCMPIVSRNDVSNRFSVAEYASGKLLRGIREKGGGFW